MEPTVRSPWIETAIITDRVRNVAFGLPNPKNSRANPECRCNCARTSRASPAAGNGIFGCGDRAPKIVDKCANAHRDKNPGIEYAEIRAETPYLASRRKRVVCKDWMVVCAVRYEPVSPGHSPENWEFFAKFSK